MEGRIPGWALRPCLLPAQEREKYPEPLGSLVPGAEWVGRELISSLQSPGDLEVTVH